MTAKSWCAISKAVEMIVVAQGTSQGRAQAWLIEACTSGNVRSRVPSASVNPAYLIADDGIVGDFRPGSKSYGGLSVFRKRAPGPVPPGAWRNAVIDGDALVDVDQEPMRGIEVSIADLDFELKQSSPPVDNIPSSPMRISRAGGRPADKEAVIAEAQRRLGAGENIPPSKAAFARDLHFWLDKQPWAYRGTKNRKVLGPAAIEESIGPLWRKYRPE